MPDALLEELKEVVLLYILEILVGINLELAAGSLIGYDDCMRMELKGTDGPHLAYALLYAVLQGTSLVVTVYHDHYLLGIHYCAYTNG